jgi:hypothetical protein
MNIHNPQTDTEILLNKKIKVVWMYEYFQGLKSGSIGYGVSYKDWLESIKGWKMIAMNNFEKHSSLKEETYGFQHDGDVCPCCESSLLTQFVPIDSLSKENLICGSCNCTFASE